MLTIAAAAWAIPIPKLPRCSPRHNRGRPQRPGQRREGLSEIMVPLIGTQAEFDMQDKIIRETAEKVLAEKGTRVKYLVGTMIEIPARR